MLIVVTHPDGYMRKTEDQVGSKSELKYHRVIVEDKAVHGAACKRFFDSEDDYHTWRQQDRTAKTTTKTKAGRGGRQSVRPRRFPPTGQVPVSGQKPEN